ncbi:hypothetical protein [Streptomyces atratus]|uniref:hypothetical protein n=1 Tax=Streptomyces atratus TaxID=1893 RepID=UPI00365FED63
MVSYEEIYKDLCARYSDDDVHGFFNVHERQVRERVWAEGRRVRVQFHFASPDNEKDTVLFTLKLGRMWNPAAGDVLVFESFSLTVVTVQRCYFAGVPEPAVELQCKSSPPEGMSGVTSFAAWHDVLSDIEHIDHISHE